MNPTLGKLDEEEIAPRFDWELVKVGITFLIAAAASGGAIYATLRLAGIVLWPR